jgi:hypothetical protein
VSTFSARSGSIQKATKTGLVPVLDDAAWLAKFLAKKAPPVPVVRLPVAPVAKPVPVVAPVVLPVVEAVEPEEHYAPWYWDDLEKFTPPKRAQAIVNRVADECGVTADSIFGPGRTRALVAVRQRAVCEVATALAGIWSLPKLARFFKRDHTTVLYSLRKNNIAFKAPKTTMHHVWKLWNEGKTFEEISRSLQLARWEVIRAFECARAAHGRGQL